MIPGGPTENLEAQRMATEDKKSEIFGMDYQYVAKKVAPTFKIPNGELYTRLESGKGEIGVFIQGNNEVTPWRFKIRAADLNNLQLFFVHLQIFLLTLNLIHNYLYEYLHIHLCNSYLWLQSFHQLLMLTLRYLKKLD